ncbi:hypothetical protein [Dactylosporangium sp. CS-033363]|uniref:hypothetical protein n=1 Tax=Dactylosporangium sp. CS-033363 TaxID=3239935 RepID=UPI003D902D1E
MPIMEVISIIGLISSFFNQSAQRRQSNQQLKNQADGLRQQVAQRRATAGAQVAGAAISTAGNLYNASQARKQELEIVHLQAELQQLRAEEAREHSRQLQESAFSHQRDLEEQKASHQLALMRERLRLDTYPFREGPGHFGRSLRLVYTDPSVMPPVLLLVPPAPGDGGPQPWSGLIARIEADLQAYQRAGLVTVKVADRHFRWPHSDLYESDLRGLPVITLEPMLAKERLEIRIGGCNLVPGSSQPVTDAEGVLPLRFPDAAWWTPQELARLNATSPTAETFQLPSPSDPRTLAELNHELASRAAVLCAVTAIDCYHLINSAGYAERIDDAVRASGIVGERGRLDGALSLNAMVDPAYHVLHRARRRIEAGDAAGALAELRRALALLAPASSADLDQVRDDPGRSLAELAAAARAGAADHHIRLFAELAEALAGTGAVADAEAAVTAVDPARAALEAAPATRHRYDPDGRSLL